MSRLEVDDGQAGKAGSGNDSGATTGGKNGSTGGKNGDTGGIDSNQGAAPPEGGAPSAGTAGASHGGTVTPEGGNGSAGTGNLAGETNTGGGSVDGDAGAGGEGGTGPNPIPPCKAVTAINGSGLTLKTNDISAFKYATISGVTKFAYDPIKQVLVLLKQNGGMSSVDPNLTLPGTASMNAITATTTYDDGGYQANTGYTDHRGIAFDANGTLYVMANQGGAASGVNIKKGVVNGANRTWTTLVTTSAGFAAGGSNFDHGFSGITLSPDGKYLFISSGSRTDHGELRGALREVPLTSAVLRVSTTTATDLKNDEAALAPYLFADGLHNAWDMAFNAEGDLIAAESGPDIDLPDELNWLQQGKHYGFPWRFGAEDNPVLDPGYLKAGDKRLVTGNAAVDDGSYVYEASFPAKPQGVAFSDPIVNYGPDANYRKIDRNANYVQAGVAGLAGITAHRTPLGITFDTAGTLCGDYYKQGFLLSYGAVVAGMHPDRGQDLLLVRLTKKNGAYTMTAKQLATTIQASLDSVLVGNRLFTIGYNYPTMYVFALPTP